jgi:hypothetical protein
MVADKYRRDTPPAGPLPNHLLADRSYGSSLACRTFALVKFKALGQSAVNYRPIRCGLASKRLVRAFCTLAPGRVLGWVVLAAELYREAIPRVPRFSPKTLRWVVAVG